MSRHPTVPFPAEGVARKPDCGSLPFASKGQSHSVGARRDTPPAMSPENVEIWRANLEALLAQLAARTDPEATISTHAEIWDPQIELDATDATALDLNRVYRGADEARQFWQEWLSAWETFSFDYELVDAGERVVMLVDMQMRGRSTGIDVPFGKFAWVSTFRDGLVVHVKLYMSQSEALDAAGLSE